MVDEYSTPDVPLKTCTKCGETKPETAFYFRRTSKNPQARAPRCSACQRTANNAWTRSHPAVVKERNAASYRKHRVTIRAKANARYSDTADHQRAYSKAWRQAHPEQFKATTKAWRQANRDTVRANNNRRKAQKRAAPLHDLTAAQWRAIKAHYGHCCVYCGRKMERLTMDHIIPLSKGGSHTLQNVVPACQSCNSRKNAGPVLKPVQPLLLV